MNQKSLMRILPMFAKVAVKISFSTAIVSFCASISYAQCDAAKQESDAAIPAMNAAAAGGAGGMGGSIGLPNAFGNAASTTGGKGGALAAAAAQCAAKAAKCKQQCDAEAARKDAQQPGSGTPMRMKGMQCQSQNMPKCQKGMDQANADKQNQQQAQQAMPSAQPQQQAKDDQQQQNPEEEKKIADCPPGMEKRGVQGDGETPICGCPAGTVLAGSTNSETGAIDQVNAGGGGGGFGFGGSSYQAGGTGQGAQCVAAGPDVRMGDTAVYDVNGQPREYQKNAIAPEVLVEGPRAVFGAVLQSQRRTAVRRPSQGPANPFADDEEEEEELEDDIAYVPPQLLGPPSGGVRKVAAHMPRVRGSRGVSARRGLKKKGFQLPPPPVPIPADDLAKRVLDPKTYQNPNIKIDLEGQKIASLISSPDPLKLCALPTRIRMLEGTGVFGEQRAAELRSQFNSRIVNFGGEAGLTMLCTTSDNSF